MISGWDRCANPSYTYLKFPFMSFPGSSKDNDDLWQNRQMLPFVLMDKMKLYAKGKHGISSLTQLSKICSKNRDVIGCISMATWQQRWGRWSRLKGWHYQKASGYLLSHRSTWTMVRMQGNQPQLILEMLWWQWAFTSAWEEFMLRFSNWSWNVLVADTFQSLYNIPPPQKKKHSELLHVFISLLLVLFVLLFVFVFVFCLFVVVFLQNLTF